jgi:anti-sigma B factor antagonist
VDNIFTHRQDGSVTLVTFTTESLMSATEMDRISAALTAIVEAGGPQFLLDCTKLRYLSSQAIGMLLGIRKKVAAIPGGKLVLRGVGPQLMELLKITNLNRVFTIE